MKKLNYLFVCGIMLASTLTITSCSSDDDEGSGAPNADNSVITNANGDKLRLTSDGVFNYHYNSEGLPVGYNTRYGNYSISYNPMVITTPDEDEKITFSLNGAGYISSAHVESKSNDDQYKESEAYSGDVSYSYDGSGHLVRVTASESGYYIEYGERYNTSETAVAEYTWSDGKLMKASMVWNRNEDGEVYTDTEEYTFEYGNATQNTLGQFSHSMLKAYTLIFNDFEECAFFGLFGKPSNAFPTKVIEGWSDSERNDQIHTRSVNPTYSFNSDGTLSSERYRSTYNYSYSNAPAASEKATVTIPFLEAKKSAKKHGIFRSHREK